MSGTGLKVLDEAGQTIGSYFKKLFIKYLTLGVAGIVIMGAIVFALVAAFWALLSQTHSPVASAGMIAGMLAFLGLLITFMAYEMKKPRS